MFVNKAAVTWTYLFVRASFSYLDQMFFLVSQVTDYSVHSTGCWFQNDHTNIHEGAVLQALLTLSCHIFMGPDANGGDCTCRADATASASFLTLHVCNRPPSFTIDKINSVSVVSQLGINKLATHTRSSHRR